MTTTGSRVALGVGMVAALLCTMACAGADSRPGATAPSTTSPELSAGTTVEWPVTRCGTYSGKGCAPDGARIDLERPVFSDPTNITNPLFPISQLDSVVLLGKVDGHDFRSETTLIPGDHSVVVDGIAIPVVVSQYTAYSDGRLEEVALDRYAQADDGSVWYLGEDVYDYRKGAIAITEGTWLAGRDGPPAMIMPAAPQVGDAFRSENVTGVVFEELTVTAIDESVEGPTGPIEGAVVMEELHLDGSVTNKVFAPGYGEFDSTNGPDFEALALAVSTDSIDEVVPLDLRLLSTSAFGILENARLHDWEAAKPTLGRMEDIVRNLRSAKYPARVVTALDAAMKDLRRAVGARGVAAASQAAIDVSQSALDLELLYRNVESERFHLHAQQLRVHAAAGDAAGVLGEVAVLEWIRDRVAASLDETRIAVLDADLSALRDAAGTRNLPSSSDVAARAAARLLGGVRPTVGRP